MSNILSEDHPALPGMELLRMMAKRWGLTADQLEAEALGRKGPSLPEDVHPLIEQAADRRATTRDVAVDASRIWFRTGREDLSEEEALELVDLVLGTHRFAVRLGKPGSGEHRLALANATAEKRVIRGPKR
jgi:hypothetical protein